MFRRNKPKVNILFADDRGRIIHFEGGAIPRQQRAYLPNRVNLEWIIPDELRDQTGAETFQLTNDQFIPLMTAEHHPIAANLANLTRFILRNHE